MLSILFTFHLIKVIALFWSLKTSTATSCTIENNWERLPGDAPLPSNLMKINSIFWREKMERTFDIDQSLVIWTVSNEWIHTRTLGMYGTSTSWKNRLVTCTGKKELTGFSSTGLTTKWLFCREILRAILRAIFSFIIMLRTTKWLSKKSHSGSFFYSQRIKDG